MGFDPATSPLKFFNVGDGLAITWYHAIDSGQALHATGCELQLPDDEGRGRAAVARPP